MNKNVHIIFLYDYNREDKTKINETNKNKSK